MQMQCFLPTVKAAFKERNHRKGPTCSAQSMAQGLEATHLAPPHGTSCLNPAPAPDPTPRRKVVRSSTGADPYTPLFGGRSRSILEGMILDVLPLVKSLEKKAKLCVSACVPAQPTA